MVKPRTIATLVIALTIAATLLTPFANIVASNSGDVDVENETVTADHDTYVDLEGYDIETNSETVWFQNGTQGSWEQASSGTDYEMNYTAGSVHALSSGDISDGEQLKVSYTYAATSGSTTTVVQLTPLFVALLILVTMASKIQDAM